MFLVQGDGDQCAISSPQNRPLILPRRQSRRPLSQLARLPCTPSMPDGHVLSDITSYGSREVETPKATPRKKSANTNCDQPTKSDADSRNQQTPIDLNKLKNNNYTVCLTSCKFALIHRVFKEAGFKSVSEKVDHNLFWTDHAVTIDRLSYLKTWQRINHFPEMSEICHKGCLSRNLNRMHAIFPLDYDIFPRTWCLPSEYSHMVTYAEKHKDTSYIVKPMCASQGRGIWIAKSYRDVSPTENTICQVYIAKPFLMDGLKFDMRVYVLITSCHPLRLYVFREGLARFTTVPYAAPSKDNMHNVYMHITNYSVQRKSDEFDHDEGEGTKRRLSSINSWLQQHNYDVTALWSRIDDVIVKTIIAGHSPLRHAYKVCFPDPVRPPACFELLGFDIILDSDLKPYVLEVNHSPSFGVSGEVDREVKETLISDCIGLLNLDPLHQEWVTCRNNMSQTKSVDQLSKRLMGATKTSKVCHRARQSLLAAEKHAAEERYEAEHLGQFRRIYPANDEGLMQTYSRFFIEPGRLHQETAAFRARTRSNKMLFDTKKRLDNFRHYVQLIRSGCTKEANYMYHEFGLDVPLRMEVEEETDMLKPSGSVKDNGPSNSSPVQASCNSNSPLSMKRPRTSLKLQCSSAEISVHNNSMIRSLSPSECTFMGSLVKPPLTLSPSHPSSVLPTIETRTSPSVNNSGSASPSTTTALYTSPLLAIDYFSKSFQCSEPTSVLSLKCSSSFALSKKWTETRSHNNDDHSNCSHLNIDPVDKNDIGRFNSLKPTLKGGAANSSIDAKSCCNIESSDKQDGSPNSSKDKTNTAINKKQVSIYSPHWKGDSDRISSHISTVSSAEQCMRIEPLGAYSNEGDTKSNRCSIKDNIFAADELSVKNELTLTEDKLYGIEQCPANKKLPQNILINNQNAIKNKTLTEEDNINRDISVTEDYSNADESFLDKDMLANEISVTEKLDTLSTPLEVNFKSFFTESLHDNVIDSNLTRINLNPTNYAVNDTKQSNKTDNKEPNDAEFEHVDVIKEIQNTTEDEMTTQMADLVQHESESSDCISPLTNSITSVICANNTELGMDPTDFNKMSKPTEIITDQCYESFSEIVEPAKLESQLQPNSRCVEYSGSSKSTVNVAEDVENTSMEEIIKTDKLEHHLEPNTFTVESKDISKPLLHVENDIEESLTDEISLTAKTEDCLQTNSCPVECKYLSKPISLIEKGIENTSIAGITTLTNETSIKPTVLDEKVSENSAPPFNTIPSNENGIEPVVFYEKNSESSLPSFNNTISSNENNISKPIIVNSEMFDKALSDVSNTPLTVKLKDTEIDTLSPNTAVNLVDGDKTELKIHSVTLNELSRVVDSQHSVNTESIDTNDTVRLSDTVITNNPKIDSTQSEDKTQAISHAKRIENSPLSMDASDNQKSDEVLSESSTSKSMTKEISLADTITENNSKNSVSTIQNNVKIVSSPFNAILTNANSIKIDHNKDKTEALGSDSTLINQNSNKNDNHNWSTNLTYPNKNDGNTKEGGKYLLANTNVRKPGLHKGNEKETSSSANQIRAGFKRPCVSNSFEDRNMNNSVSHQLPEKPLDIYKRLKGIASSNSAKPNNLKPNKIKSSSNTLSNHKSQYNKMTSSSKTTSSQSLGNYPFMSSENETMNISSSNSNCQSTANNLTDVIADNMAKRMRLINHRVTESSKADVSEAYYKDEHPYGLSESPSISMPKSPPVLAKGKFLNGDNISSPFYSDMTVLVSESSSISGCSKLHKNKEQLSTLERAEEASMIANLATHKSQKHSLQFKPSPSGCLGSMSKNNSPQIVEKTNSTISKDPKRMVPQNSKETVDSKKSLLQSLIENRLRQQNKSMPSTPKCSDQNQNYTELVKNEPSGSQRKSDWKSSCQLIQKSVINKTLESPGVKLSNLYVRSIAGNVFKRDPKNPCSSFNKIIDKDNGHLVVMHSSMKTGVEVVWDNSGCNNDYSNTTTQSKQPTKSTETRVLLNQSELRGETTLKCLHNSLKYVDGEDTLNYKTELCGSDSPLFQRDENDSKEVAKSPISIPPLFHSNIDKIKPSSPMSLSNVSNTCLLNHNNELCGSNSPLFQRDENGSKEVLEPPISTPPLFHSNMNKFRPSSPKSLSNMSNTCLLNHKSELCGSNSPLFQININEFSLNSGSSVQQFENNSIKNDQASAIESDCSIQKENSSHVNELCNFVDKSQLCGSDSPLFQLCRNIDTKELEQDTVSLNSVTDSKYTQPHPQGVGINYTDIKPAECYSVCTLKHFSAGDASEALVSSEKDSLTNGQLKSAFSLTEKPCQSHSTERYQATSKHDHSDQIDQSENVFDNSTKSCQVDFNDDNKVLQDEEFQDNHVTLKGTNINDHNIQRSGDVQHISNNDNFIKQDNQLTKTLQNQNIQTDNSTKQEDNEKADISTNSLRGKVIDKSENRQQSNKDEIKELNRNLEIHELRQIQKQLKEFQNYQLEMKALQLQLKNNPQAESFKQKNDIPKEEQNTLDFGMEIPTYTSIEQNTAEEKYFSPQPVLHSLDTKIPDTNERPLATEKPFCKLNSSIDSVAMNAKPPVSTIESHITNIVMPASRISQFSSFAELKGPPVDNTTNHVIPTVKMAPPTFNNAVPPVYKPQTPVTVDGPCGQLIKLGFGVPKQSIKMNNEVPLKQCIAKLETTMNDLDSMSSVTISELCQNDILLIQDQLDQWSSISHTPVVESSANQPIKLSRNVTSKPPGLETVCVYKPSIKDTNKMPCTESSQVNDFMVKMSPNRSSQNSQQLLHRDQFVRVKTDPSLPIDTPGKAKSLKTSKNPPKIEPTLAPKPIPNQLDHTDEKINTIPPNRPVIKKPKSKSRTRMKKFMKNIKKQKNLPHNGDFIKMNRYKPIPVHRRSVKRSRIPDASESISENNALNRQRNNSLSVPRHKRYSVSYDKRQLKKVEINRKFARAFVVDASVKYLSRPASGSTESIHQVSESSASSPITIREVSSTICGRQLAVNGEPIVLKSKQPNRTVKSSSTTKKSSVPVDVPPQPVKFIVIKVPNCTPSQIPPCEATSWSTSWSSLPVDDEEEAEMTRFMDKRRENVYSTGIRGDLVHILNQLREKMTQGPQNKLLSKSNNYPGHGKQPGPVFKYEEEVSVQHHSKAPPSARKPGIRVHFDTTEYPAVFNESHEVRHQPHNANLLLTRSYSKWVKSATSDTQLDTQKQIQPFMGSKPRVLTGKSALPQRNKNNHNRYPKEEEFFYRYRGPTTKNLGGRLGKPKGSPQSLWIKKRKDHVVDNPDSAINITCLDSSVIEKSSTSLICHPTGDATVHKDISVEKKDTINGQHLSTSPPIFSTTPSIGLVNRLLELRRRMTTCHEYF